MNYISFSAGVLLLIITATDLIRTALSVNGAGFITRRLSKAIWKMLLAINRNLGQKKILEMGGAMILISILITWLLLIWTGASLMFISQPDDLMNVETNTQASIISKIFYTGYTLSTLGLGDMEPDGAYWEVLTAVLSFAGLILLSIAVTYLIPVVSAEIEKRRISVFITTLGCSVQEILTNYWNGENFKSLETPFSELTKMIILHSQNHKAYSVLHFFHTSNKKEAFVLNITNLDEALTILLHHVSDSVKPEYNILIGLRKAISSYLVTLPSAFVTPSDEVPPVLKLSELEDMGVPIEYGEKVDVEYENLTSRRRLLLSLIKDDGWEWEDLEAGSYDHELSMIKPI